jgi:excisionase family DNA binding protein
VSRRSIRLWAERGELRGIKIGWQWRFRREVIQKRLPQRGRCPESS